MNTRAIRVALVMALVVSAFGVALTPASAEPAPDPNGPDPIEELLTANEIYFPWVPNGQMLGDSGPYTGDVVVQNVSLVFTLDLHFFVGVGTSEDSWEEAYVLNNVAPYASTTVSASDLGIEEPGASVYVEGRIQLDDPIFLEESIDEPWDPGFTPQGMISGAVKSVSPIPSDNALTTAGHDTVDGYTSMTRQQVAPIENDQHILPIVQNNTGWQTEIRLSSFADEGSNTNYTIELFGTGDGGGDASFSTSGTFRSGEVRHYSISDLVDVDEGWVGSAYITANAPVGAVAERYKNETDMLLTNVSRPVEQPSFYDWGDEPVLVFADNHRAIAPLVFQEYNFWNTGISVANTSDSPNDVQIRFITPAGNQVGSEAFRIPPRGMKYLYLPGSQDLSLDNGFTGSAVIQGSESLHAAVDQVKYFGDDRDAGNAMSYVTEPPMPQIGDPSEGQIGEIGPPGSELSSDFDFDFGLLSFPLVQKGNPGTNTGDTSGIQLMNTSSGNPAYASLSFVTTTGNPATAAGIEFELSAHQSATVYTHNYSSLPEGFRGSAFMIYVGTLSAVSNNVNYEVATDGSAVFTPHRFSLFQFLLALADYEVPE